MKQEGTEGGQGDNYSLGRSRRRASGQRWESGPRVQRVVRRKQERVEWKQKQL